MISTTEEERTYRHVPRVLTNYFKLRCQVNGVHPSTYEVEEDSDIKCAHAGDLSTEAYMITVNDRSSYDVLQKVFEEAYA